MTWSRIDRIQASNIMRRAKSHESNMLPSGTVTRGKAGRDLVEAKRPAPEDLRRWYLDERDSVRFIAFRLGVSGTTVYRWLDEAEIPRRRSRSTWGVYQPPVAR